jgi:hypothetical protein
MWLQCANFCITSGSVPGHSSLKHITIDLEKNSMCPVTPVSYRASLFFHLRSMFVVYKIYELDA